MKGRRGGLKQVEKRAYLTWHRDGLADIGLGMLVLLFGIGMKYDQTLLAPIYGCVGYPIWLLLKERITERRLGWVAFGAQRKRRERRGWTLLFILGCGVFLMGIGAYTVLQKGGSLEVPGYLLISMIFVVLISSLGAVMELNRLHIYSGVVLGLGAAGHVFGWEPETGIVLPGAVIVLSGGVLLVTFLTKYPLMKDGDELTESDEGTGQ